LSGVYIVLYWCRRSSWSVLSVINCVSLSVEILFYSPSPCKAICWWV